LFNSGNKPTEPLTLETFSAELKAVTDAFLEQMTAFKRVVEDLAKKVDDAPSSFPKHLASADLGHHLVRVGKAFAE